MDTQTPHGATPPSTGGVDEVARETGATEILNPEQCWELLAQVEVGRLAIAAAGDVDIFPINFVIDDGAIVFRTAEGTKLVEIVLAGKVAFEVDGYEPEHGRAWSVVVKGVAENLERFGDLYHAEELPLFPWNASPKERFVRLEPMRITGRRFTVLRTRSGDEPQL